MKNEIKNQDSGLVSGFVRLLVCIAGTFLVVLIINTYIIQQTVVSGESMYDTLSEKDRILINKVGDVKRYDVVVFENDKDIYFIKRVYGLPGEKIRIDEHGDIYINGAKIADPYKTESIYAPGIADDEIFLEEDEYFLLGDNRNKSADSRTVEIGPVKRDKIIGKAWLRFYPVRSFGLIENIV